MLDRRPLNRTVLRAACRASHCTRFFPRITRHAARLLVLLVLIVLASQPALADTVSLINGRVIQGKVSFDAREGLVVLPKNLPSQRVELADLLGLTIDGRDAKPPKRRVTLVSGAQIAGDEVLAVNEREVRLKRSDGSLLNLNTALVSKIDFRPADAAPASPASFVGVQLATGDLAEGEIVSVDEREAKISSVLFGIQSFDLRNAVRSVCFRGTGASGARYLVRTADGSEWHATSLRIDKGRLHIESDGVGRTELNGDTVTSIELGPAGAEPMTGGQPVTLAPGQSREFPLGTKYRAALMTVSVPTRFVPNRPVRFVVAIDGKEVAKTDALTSIDGPQLLTVSVTGAQTMTVRLDAEGPPQLGVAGTITDVKLVRAN